MVLMALVPSPHDCGLPEQFDKWRAGQEEALHLTQTSKARHIPVCAPTGFGKSPWIVADALLSGENCAILTNTKGLQDQYMREYASIGMTDIRGRNNYTCKMKDGYTCEDGYVARCPYKGTVACECTRAEVKASLSRLVVTNYAKWTHTKRMGGGLDHITRIYLDEAHNVPGAIAQAMQIYLGFKEMEEGLGIPFPVGHYADDINEWKAWARTAKTIADPELTKAMARITGVNDVKVSWLKHYIHMKNVCRRLGILALAKPDEWVVEAIDTGYIFDPVSPGKYAESTMFLRVPKIIWASATLRPKTLFMSGVGSREFEFKEFDSSFDPKRCPIYYIPTMRVDSKAKSLSKLWLMLDQIMSRRRGVKGIIHTVSYPRQREIMETSRFWESMVANVQGGSLADAVGDYLSADPGATLVSPTVSEGWDFKGDACRWQFMTKIPFEPPSKIVKAREAKDSEYRAYQALQYMVQAFGRGMREESDWCVCPSTRILTRDLRWKSAGLLKRGEKLLAFSENPNRSDVRGSNIPRSWERSSVVSTKLVKSPRLRIIHESGELVCTPEHPLLTHNLNRTSVWTRALNLSPGMRLVKLLNVWEDPTEYSQGWLAGFTDGEGCLQIGNSPKRGGLQGLYLAQNEGVALTELECHLISQYFSYGWQSRSSNCKVLRLSGGVPEILRYLGSIRPVRLLEKYLDSCPHERLLSQSNPRVLRVEKMKDGDIVRLHTTSHTYISEGLASHNCENFIGDEHMEWFYPKFRHLAPRSFHGFFQIRNTIPAPLRLS